jgi:hypothetical protein
MLVLNNNIKHGGRNGVEYFDTTKTDETGLTLLSIKWANCAMAHIYLH